MGGDTQMLVIWLVCVCSIYAKATPGDGSKAVFNVPLYISPDPNGDVEMKCLDNPAEHVSIEWAVCAGCGGSGSYQLTYNITKEVRHIPGTTLEILDDMHQSNVLRFHAAEGHLNVTVTFCCHVSRETYTKRVVHVRSAKGDPPGNFLARHDEMTQIVPLVDGLVLSCEAACPQQPCVYIWNTKGGMIPELRLKITEPGQPECLNQTTNTSILRFKVTDGDAREMTTQIQGVFVTNVLDSTIVSQTFGPTAATITGEHVEKEATAETSTGSTSTNETIPGPAEQIGMRDHMVNAIVITLAVVVVAGLVLMAVFIPRGPCRRGRNDQVNPPQVEAVPLRDANEGNDEPIAPPAH